MLVDGIDAVVLLGTGWRWRRAHLAVTGEGVVKEGGGATLQGFRNVTEGRSEGTRREHEVPSHLD